MKSERFNIRMTPQEKASIISRAKKANRTTSEFMIDAALNHRIVVIDELPKAVQELKAIGRNLNQIATLCNMGRVQCVGFDPFTERLADLHSDLFKLTEAV